MEGWGGWETSSTATLGMVNFGYIKVERRTVSNAWQHLAGNSFPVSPRTRKDPGSCRANAVESFLKRRARAPARTLPSVNFTGSF